MLTTKEAPQVNTVPLDSEEHTFGDPQWRTGMKARFPWTGFTALCTILLCANSSVIILLLTDGKKQQAWAEKMGPSVWLSAFNGIANICFGIAIANGVAITWWRKALRGATIEELHRSWQFSASIKDVVLYGKYFNFIALAALAAKLTIIDGILLQKAANTAYGPDDAHNTTIKMYVNDTMPFTASITHLPGTDGSPAYGFVDNQLGWFDTQVSMWLKDSGSFYSSDSSITDNCAGTCLFSVHGTGFGVDCQTEELAIDYGREVVQAAIEQAALANETALINDTSTPPPDTSRKLFEITFEALYGANGQDGNYSKIMMNVTFTNTTQDKNDPKSCPGTLTRHSCILRPAIVKYPVTIVVTSAKDDTSDSNMYLGYNTTSYGGQTWYTDSGISDDGFNYPYTNDVDRAYAIQNGDANGTSSAYDSKVHQLIDYEMIEPKDVLETDPLVTEQMSTVIGGIARTLGDKLYGSSSLESSNGQFVMNPYGLATDPIFAVEYNTTTPECGYQYPDPLEYVIRRINMLMFRLSINPLIDDRYIKFDSDSSPVEAPFTAREYSVSLHYKTNRGFMYGALGSILVCVLCVLPSYWGYWQLGRDVTLGPFEIANAFRAPVLDHPSVANAGVKVLIREVGQREVKYGEMVQNDASGRLAIAEPEAVRRVHPRIHDRSM
ncbi:hypothetical protein E4T44_02777 [Aureobasidium sp. EXF-8845]|nr:hypothetical protein E4T44_02777 [Aureobasidium sp. EXF-8845]KAI4857883.1 hypothetical protein E4T45_00608 [Aureobasidium sp. EXF-8846]